MTENTVPTIARQPYGVQLKSLHETAMSLEKMRVSMGNRIQAVDRNVDTIEPEVEEFYKRLVVQAESWEKEIDDLMAAQVKHFPVYDAWLSHVKGIGPSLSAHLLALLLPPIPEAGPSTWYKAAGLVPELRPDGTNRLPRARVGEGAITYHPWLRRCLFLVAQSFVRVGGYYREVYERDYDRLFHVHAWNAAKFIDGWRSTSVGARAGYVQSHYDLSKIVEAWQPWLDIKGAGIEDWRLFAVEDMEATKAQRFQEKLDVELMEPAINKAFALVGISDPEWPLGRIERVARWAMMKLFMAHLWEEWLRAEGQNGRRAYVVEKLGHHYQAPPEWDGKKKA